MTPYKKRLNKYIQRMVEDMQVRNFAEATIDAYTYHADKFCQHFGKTADNLGPEEIRAYQLYLVNKKKVGWSSFNQAVCGLRFLYEITLQKPWTIRHIPFGKRPKKLPVVLSDEEVVRLLACVDSPDAGGHLHSPGRIRVSSANSCAARGVCTDFTSVE